MQKYMVFMIVSQVIALLAWTSIARAEAGAIAVGNMQLAPAIKLSESRNDNIFMQESAAAIKKSWITTIEPTITLSSDNGASQYELGYQLSEGIYHQSHADDFTDHFVNFNADLGLSRKLTVGFNIAYNLAHDARGATFTGGAAAGVAAPDKYHETVVGGSVDYGTNAHMIVSGEYSNKRYTNNRARTTARDIDIAGVIAEFDYDLTGKTAAVLEARYKQFNYQLQTATVNLDSNEQAYFAGLNWQATAKTSGSVRVGYVKKNFAKTTTADRGFFSWEVSAEWLPMSYSSWTLQTGSFAAETDGSGTFIKNTNVSASWDHSWSESVSHTASLGYTRGDYQGTSTRIDNTTSASVSVNYQWLRWLAIQPAYNYTNRSSNAARSSYKGNVWSINLIGTL